MNIEREFPLHVAVWNNDTEKLGELIKENKVSNVLQMDIQQGVIDCVEQ